MSSNKYAASKIVCYTELLKKNYCCQRCYTHNLYTSTVKPDKEDLVSVQLNVPVF